MARIRSTGTTPENAFNSLLSAQGIRLDRDCDDLPGKPDFADRDRKIAIFIDGDFWHGGQWGRRGFGSLQQQIEGKSNANHWLNKIVGNVRRDLNRTTKLSHSGWYVLRFWETELFAQPDRCVQFVLQLINLHMPTKQSVGAATFAEFFAGIGLVRLGLEAAGWTGVFANDNDPVKHRLYRNQFGDHSHLDQRSITKLSADDIPEVALATASFPCTDVSLAGGKRGINGSQSRLFWTFANLIEDMGHRRPKLLLIENVVGLIHSKDGNDLKSCLKRVNALGYFIDAFILDAKNFAPHSRPRMFIVATDKNLSQQIPPALWSDDPGPLRGRPLGEFLREHDDLEWRFRSLPTPPPRSTSLRDVVEDLPENDRRWWSEERLNRLLGQMSERHRNIADEITCGHIRRYGTIFRRMRNNKSMAELRTDGLAGCLRTPKGGSARQILFQGCRGRCRARLLTPKECARLMGADNYHISESVSANDLYFGFGDAVCVPAVKWIADNYLNPLFAELLHQFPVHHASERDLISSR
jgi:DNA (cytosine-5)-methyltransferase 1